MIELLRNRVGLEVFREKIVEVTRHADFVRTSQRPDPTVSSQNQILLDFDFIKFYKYTEGTENFRFRKFFWYFFDGHCSKIKQFSSE